MKKSFIIVFSITLLIVVSQLISKTDNQTLYAMNQEETIQQENLRDTTYDIPEYLKHYKEKYEAAYKAPFEIVWNAVKESLTELNCYYQTPSFRVDTSGLYVGSITTEDWVFAEGSDSTYDLLKLYGLDVPQIPGAIWTSGRLNFKFKIQQVNDDSIKITLKTRMSGREDSTTGQVHFWKSNGLLEEKVLGMVEAKMQAYYKENN